MPAYIVRIAGTNILAGFYAAPSRMHLSLLIDEEVDPSNFECAVIRGGYGIVVPQGWRPRQAHHRRPGGQRGA